jgi:hypothetical protein
VDPPRVFEVGHDEKIQLRDCARIDLEPEEQVTFTTESGGEYDVTRKAWGFYATPSLNGRLPRFGLRGVLVRNRLDQYFVLLVERGRETLFAQYVSRERLVVVSWLDDPGALAHLDPTLRA